MLLRHAQPRKPKNEALIYSLLIYSEVRYSRGFTLRHATIRLQLNEACHYSNERLPQHGAHALPRPHHSGKLGEAQGLRA
jgi:hypothetical protein